MPRGRFTEAQLKDLVRDHAASGKTATEFCRITEGLALSTFTRAIRRYSLVAARAKNAANAALQAEGKALPPQPAARSSTSQVEALRKEVRALRKMLACQWGLVKAG